MVIVYSNIYFFSSEKRFTNVIFADFRMSRKKIKTYLRYKKKVFGILKFFELHMFKYILRFWEKNYIFGTNSEKTPKVLYFCRTLYFAAVRL